MSKLRMGIGQIVFGLFLAVVFSLGLMKPSIGGMHAAVTPTDLIFPALLVSWLVEIAIGSSRFKWRPEFYAFAVFFLALLISSVFSADPGRSFIKLAGAGYLIVLAILATQIVRTSSRLRAALLAWIAGSFIPLAAGVLAIGLFYLKPDSDLLALLTHHYGSVPVGPFPRLSSTFVSASMFCNYLTVTLVLALIADKLRWISRAWITIVVAVIIISAIFTFSITLGGLALAIGLWFWATSENSSVQRLSLSLGILAAFFFLAIAPFSLSPIFGEPSARALVWAEATRVFLADPITGTGFGTAVANVVFQNSDGSVSLLTDAHNVFLSIAAQTGIVGILAIIALVFVISKAGLIYRPTSGDMKVVRQGLIIAFFVGFLYDGVTGAFEDARHLWMLMGLILAASSIDEPQHSASLHGT